MLYTDKKKGSLVIEGYYQVMDDCNSTEDYIPLLVINNDHIECDKIDRSSVKKHCDEKKSCQIIGFRCPILFSNNVSIHFALKKSGNVVLCTNIESGLLFPVTTTYKNAYAVFEDKLIYFKCNRLEIMDTPHAFSLATLEVKWLVEIWRKKLKNSKKAIIVRLFYHLAKPFKKRRLWIVSDRIMKADDNGEAFFTYLMQHRPKKTRILFAINNKSADYYRIKRIGPCVNAPSARYSLLYLLCDMMISSSADQITIHPAGYNDALRDLVTRPKFVFLQHGVILNDVSRWLNRYSIKIDGFITSANRESDSIINGQYGYPPEHVWLTGLPRYDRLYQDEKKKITIMPTWRMYLFEGEDGKKGRRIPVSDFYNSEYYTFYHSLLNSKRLLQTSEALGYTIRFFPHPVIQLSNIDFLPDTKIECPPFSTFYRELYASSSLIVTDYSSAVFDFAYLRKPVLYCHFDRDHFFTEGHICQKGYFNYEKDGFGEVEYTLDSIVDRIIEYMENDCQLKPRYKKRIDTFFAFSDTDCCKRVLEKVISLDQ